MADSGVVLRDVVAGYGAREVLRGVSLECRPGEVTGVIGPNGSGKTTLIRVAARGVRPASGSVTVAGRDPFRLSAREAARLAAVVPQELASIFSYTVLEVVLMGRSPYLPPWGGGRSEDWALVREAMAAANVQHLADRPVGELSGGERQRVTLAQALAQDAPVLLMDEPTTHLDLRHVLDLLSVVRHLAVERGRTVVAVFHDLNLAATYCDAIHALSDGRVVASGPPSSVVTGAMVREVFGIEANVLPTGAAGRPAVLLPGASLGRPRAGAPRAHVIGGAGRGAGVMRALAEAGLEVTAGVLHEGDTDAVVAERLNLLRVTVPAFSEIDPGSAEHCRGLIESASVLVVCDPPIGPGNVGNLWLALEAVERGTPVVLLEQVPMAERDFTGGEAGRLWARLARESRVVSSLDGVVEEMTSLLPAPR